MKETRELKNQKQIEMAERGRVRRATAWRWLAVPVALALCQCQVIKPVKLSDYATHVPITIRQNLPFVTVELGGKRSQFLVDSGASDCVVTPETAQRMGLTVSEEKVLVKTAAGDRVPIPMAVVPKLSIGKAEFHNVPAFVYDFGKIRHNLGSFDGVVGFSIFRDASLTIDYSRKEMRITPGPLLNAKHPGTIAMSVKTGVPRIPLKGGPRPTWVDVDSGSTGGLEINPKNAGLPTEAAPRPGGLSSSIGSTYRTGMARVKGTLLLGAVELSDPIVEVTAGDYRVGGEILQHTVMTLDQPSKLAQFTIGKPSLWRIFGVKHALHSPSRIGTGVGFDSNWVVQDVVPSSPASKAGVQVGDVCVTIQGRSTAGLQDQYSRILEGSSQITYQLKRGEKTFSVTVPVVLQVR